MRLLEMFYNHSHYWGVPHPRSTDNKIVQVCYECGAEREVKVQLRQPDEVRINLPYRDDVAA